MCSTPTSEPDFLQDDVLPTLHTISAHGMKQDQEHPCGREAAELAARIRLLLERVWVAFICKRCGAFIDKSGPCPVCHR